MCDVELIAQYAQLHPEESDREFPASVHDVRPVGVFDYNMTEYLADFGRRVPFGDRVVVNGRPVVDDSGVAGDTTKTPQRFQKFQLVSLVLEPLVQVRIVKVTLL